MATFLPFTVLLLVLALLCFLLYYFYLQQSLGAISSQLAALQSAKVIVRGGDVIRRETAYLHDQLILLEADLTNFPREFLDEEDMALVDLSRQTIKRCVGELKQSGEWLGLPFDFEWNEIMQRVPKVIALFRLTLSQSSWVDDARMKPVDVMDVSARKYDLLELRLR
jgi:hypothetical protein